MDYQGFGECEPMRLLPKQIPIQQVIPRGIRLAAAAAAANSHISDGHHHHLGHESSSSKSPQITSTVLKRTCNVDVDPKNISDRTEWAIAQYHSYYNPHCLFELEIRWLIATSCLLGDLITNWSQRTGAILGSNQLAFHLVPIPCDPFAEFDPLRGASKAISALLEISRPLFAPLGPIYIKIDLSCLHGILADLSEKDRMLRMNIFQELIVKRFEQLSLLRLLFLSFQLWLRSQLLCQLRGRKHLLRSHQWWHVGLHYLRCLQCALHSSSRTCRVERHGR